MPAVIFRHPISKGFLKFHRFPRVTHPSRLLICHRKVPWDTSVSVRCKWSRWVGCIFFNFAFAWAVRIVANLHALVDKVYLTLEYFFYIKTYLQEQFILSSLRSPQLSIPLQIEAFDTHLSLEHWIWFIKHGSPEIIELKRKSCLMFMDKYC